MREFLSFRLCSGQHDGLKPPGLCSEGGEDFGGFGTDAEVGVGLREEDGVVLRYDDDAGDGEAPAGFGGGLIV